MTALNLSKTFVLWQRRGCLKVVLRVIVANNINWKAAVQNVTSNRIKDQDIKIVFISVSMQLRIKSITGIWLHSSLNMNIACWILQHVIVYILDKRGKNIPFILIKHIFATYNYYISLILLSSFPFLLLWYFFAALYQSLPS